MVNKFKKAIDTIMDRHKEQLKQGQQVNHKQLFDRMQGVRFSAQSVLDSNTDLQEVYMYIDKSLAYDAE